MSFNENVCDGSFFMMESYDGAIIRTAAPDINEYINYTPECPSLWPTLSYNQCNSDSDKEIWITMFDDDTTMDIFPTPPVTPQSTTKFKSALSSSPEPMQAVKYKLSNDSSIKIHPIKQYTDDMPLTQKAITNLSFKNFKWQASQTDICQPIQHLVKRRLD